MYNSKQQRMFFFESRLFWLGRASRKDLANYFEISLERASAAIRGYLKLAPENAHYDPSKKVYRATKDFAPVFTPPSSAHVIGRMLLEDEFLSPLPIMAPLPAPKGAIPTEPLRTLLTAIAEKSSLIIVYRSMSASEPIKRQITPHSFAHDGRKWQVRAYCSSEKEFRFFALSRIVETGSRQAPQIGGHEDSMWNESVKLRIAPHPNLPEPQKSVIAMDYGMVDGEASFTVRKAMLPYLLRSLDLHRPEGELRLSPKEQQIILLDPELRNLV